MDLQLPMQSVAITADAVSSSPDQGEVYNIKVNKICQWLATGRWFCPGRPVSSTNKTDRHDILVAEILLKVALSTIKQTNKQIEGKVHIGCMFLHTRMHWCNVAYQRDTNE